MRGAPLESLGPARGVDLDVVRRLALAVVHRRDGGNCGDVILRARARLPFMPGDPRCCYDDGTGVGRWSSCVLLAGNHPSLRVVITGLLLLSHAWPRFSSVSSLLYETLYPSLLGISPLLLSFLQHVSLHPPSPSFIHFSSLLFRLQELPPPLRCVCFSGLLLCCSSSPAVISFTLCHIRSWVRDQRSVFVTAAALLHPHVWKPASDLLPSLPVSAHMRRQTGPSSRPRSCGCM